MHTTRHIARLGTILFTLAVIVSGVQAQQQDQGQDTNQNESQNPSQPQGGPTQATQPTAPIPAVHSPLASLSSVQDNQPQEMTPDTRALSGAQYLTVGGPAYSHSYWQPSLDVAFTAYSSPLIGGSGTDWTTYTTILGQIDVHKISGVSNLDFIYQGAGYFATGAGEGSNSVMQQVGVAEVLNLHRWKLSLIDELGYFPQAAFGYTGLGIGIVPNQGTNLGLQNGFVPSQSILTAPGQRLSNTGVVEGDLLLTPRSSLTMLGSVGTLHYFDDNLNDTTAAVASIGYNYNWTRKDTIAVFYTFGAFRYNNINQSINSNSFQLSYARRVTGKLSFQVSGGPDWVQSTQPITGSSGVTTTTTSETTDLLWTANAALTYQARRGSLTVTYSHGVTGGSGVLAGAVSDNLTGTWSRQLTRMTTLSFTGGYSRNKGIALTPGTGITSAPYQSYNYWFGGATIAHRFSNSLGVSFGYTGQFQNSNAVFCVVAPCTTNYTSNQIIFDLNFRPRLIPF
jgi:hypothetical protein